MAPMLVAAKNDTTHSGQLAAKMGHPVAVADAPLPQRGGRSRHLGDEVVEGVPLVIQHQELPVAEVGSVGHHLPQRPHSAGEHLGGLPQDLLGGQLEQPARSGQLTDHVLTNTHGPEP